jgi:hypothetical protein
VAGHAICCVKWVEIGLPVCASAIRASLFFSSRLEGEMMMPRATQRGALPRRSAGPHPLAKFRFNHRLENGTRAYG